MRKVSNLWSIGSFLFLIFTLFIPNVMSQWEYAIATNKRIYLYDSNWANLKPIIYDDQLTSITTITYDAIHDIFYFADRENSTIFSFTLDGKSFSIEEAFKTETKKIQDLVYDFHDDALYWSTREYKQIMKYSLKSRKMETFLETEDEISGLELDTCNRNLYFTTTTGERSVNVVPLDKSANYKSFGSGAHTRPIAISLDHQNRRLYVADIQDYGYYSIDSYDSSGVDYKRVIHGKKVPKSIANDKNFVYFTETHETGDTSLNSFSKYDESKDLKTKFTLTSTTSTDIIVRSNFIIDHDAKNCKVSPSTMKKVQEEKKLNEMSTNQPTKQCFNGGSFKSSNCICKESFSGEFCEINLCYNFCLNNGNCAMARSSQTQNLEPQCTCENGFIGKHCEVNVCNNYCLNSGDCLLDNKHQPRCRCTNEFVGDRCEISKSFEMSMKTTTITVPVDSNITTVASTLLHQVPNSNENLLCPPSSIIEYPRNFWIFGAIGTTTLIIIAVLVIALIWKKKAIPLPRPHKKYVIHKKMDNLTYRPTTESCEVVIEDCCNMNICETPCYDPKVLQQEINETMNNKKSANFNVKLTSSKKCNGGSKEDKQNLLKNMEVNQ